MINLILQYAMDGFVAVMTVAYFSLFTLDLRNDKGLPVPRFFIAARESGMYYVCMSWVALFFAAYFMFTYQEFLLRLWSVPFFVISFLYWPLYRHRVEVLRFKGCRHP